MTPSEAYGILSSMPFDRFSEAGLHLRWKNGFGFVNAVAGLNAIKLEGSFSLDQLRAIAAWAEDPNAVMGAGQNP